MHVTNRVCFVLLAGWLARIGSGIFLIIQMVILLDFVQCWNDSWAANGEEDDRWYYALLSITGVAYALALTLAGVWSSLYSSHGLANSLGSQVVVSQAAVWKLMRAR